MCDRPGWRRALLQLYPRPNRLQSVLEPVKRYGKLSLIYVVLFLYILILHKDVREHLPESQQFVCTVFRGRLGNRLFQYASLYGIAKKNGKRLGIHKDSFLLDRYFALNGGRKLRLKRTCNLFERVKEQFFGAFDKDLMTLDPNQNYRIFYFLQSWKYFRDYFDEIRDEFKFVPDIEDFADVTIEDIKARTNKTTVIGVHIRRGDVLKPSLQDDGYQTAPIGYIYRAMRFMMSRYNSTVFIVCSDDINFAKRIIPVANASVVLMNGSEIEDFAVLVRSDHVITTTGTFGWWAGFLSGGDVIYYKYPYRKESKLGMKFKLEDFFLESWVGLT